MKKNLRHQIGADSDYTPYQEALSPDTTPARLLELAETCGEQVEQNPLLPLISLEDPTLYQTILAKCAGRYIHWYIHGGTRRRLTPLGREYSSGALRLQNTFLAMAHRYLPVIGDKALHVTVQDMQPHLGYTGSSLKSVYLTPSSKHPGGWVIWGFGVWGVGDSAATGFTPGASSYPLGTINVEGRVTLLDPTDGGKKTPAKRRVRLNLIAGVCADEGGSCAVGNSPKKQKATVGLADPTEGGDGGGDGGEDKKIKDLLEYLSPTLQHQWATDCLQHALPEFERSFPGKDYLAKMIGLRRDFTAGKVSFNTMMVASPSLFPFPEDETNPAFMSFCMAAMTSDAYLTSKYVAEAVMESQGIGYAYVLERKWQLQHLERYVNGTPDLNGGIGQRTRPREGKRGKGRVGGMTEQEALSPILFRLADLSTQLRDAFAWISKEMDAATKMNSTRFDDPYSVVESRIRGRFYARLYQDNAPGVSVSQRLIDFFSALASFGTVEGDYTPIFSRKSSIGKNARLFQTVVDSMSPDSVYPNISAEYQGSVNTEQVSYSFEVIREACDHLLRIDLTPAHVRAALYAGKGEIGMALAVILYQLCIPNSATFWNTQ